MINAAGLTLRPSRFRAVFRFPLFRVRMRADGNGVARKLMRKLIVLTSGWGLLVVGGVLSATPVPIPMIGVVPMLTGAAILSANSKPFRRRVQGLRHRFAFLSRWLERFVHRGPRLLKVMVRRTRPHALHRHARMKRRNA